MTFFTSDLHLGHSKDFVYKARGFNTIEEHDAAIINNINSMVAADDELWILGDLMLGNNESGLAHLRNINCQHIHIIYGNHDTDNRIVLYGTLPNVICHGFADRIRHGKKWFMLSHYPMNIDNGNDRTPVFNLYGHTHQVSAFASPNTFKNYNVGVDAHNNYPVSIDTIIEDINTQKARLS